MQGAPLQMIAFSIAGKYAVIKILYYCDKKLFIPFHFVIFYTKRQSGKSSADTKRREEKARQILEQRNRAATTQTQVITNNPQPPVINNQMVNTNTSNVPNENKEFDLQKELEKKFDELFGSDNN